MRGILNRNLGLLESLQPRLFLLDFEPEPDGLADVRERLLARCALRMTTNQVGAAHGPAFVGLKKSHAVVHDGTFLAPAAGCQKHSRRRKESGKSTCHFLPGSHGLRRVSAFPLTPRREFLRQAGWLAAGAALAAKLPRAFAADDTGVVGSVTLPFENGERELVAYPQKRPLIRLTTRPPQLETPFAVFNDGLVTPNDAFFVRYHLSEIPLRIDPAAHRVAVRGLVQTPLSLSLADLKALGDPVEFYAVNQCSGNSRGFFSPRANGGQLGHGAMGNAKWTGVPLRRVLERAGVGAGAKQVSFRGLDRSPIEATPVFAKALDLDHALDGEVMIAWAMNGTDLPMLNGYPVRLVVPGYYGTYWVKHLSEIEVLDHGFDGFWMAKSYRIPDNPTHSVEPGTSPAATVPINKLAVRSFITSPAAGASVSTYLTLTARGIAFDAGSGIREVAFSADGGATWQATNLGAELGRYAFREWKTTFKINAPGPVRLMARATNRAGETQPLEASWNPSGYMRNVVEAVEIRAARM